MLGDIPEARECDILAIAGGINDASSLDNPESCREAIHEAISAAKDKARRVIVMPPPPVVHPQTCLPARKVTSILSQEAHRARVEFVNVAPAFQDPSLRGANLFVPDGLHMAKLGGGIYAHALLDHLGNFHSDLQLVYPLCIGCYHTSHQWSQCEANRRGSGVPAHNDGFTVSRNGRHR